MKQYKYQLNDTVLYDYQYIQRHLTEMAAKGWRLDKISTLGVWRYRRAEPAPIRYEVTYAPSASAYNSRPTAQEEALTDICEEAGWVKVASMAQLHIYCNEDPDATPLETDELSRIRTLRKSMNRHFVPSYLLMIALFVVQLWMQLSNVFKWPTTTLSSPLMVGNLAMLSLAILCYIAMIGGYLRWVHRAEQTARDGLSVPECVFYRRFRFVLWFVIVAYVALLLLTAELWIVGSILLMAAAALAATSFTIDLCKEMGAPKWANIAVPFLVTFLVMMLVWPIIFGFWDTASLTEEPEVPAELPLTITDLLDTGEELTTVAYEESSSPLASRTRFWQEAEDSGLTLSYTIVDTDFGFAYDLCLHDMEQDFMASADFWSNGIISTNQGSLWDAEYVRQAPGDFNDRWFICWEGRIVNLRTSWPLTEAQIAVIAEALKP